MKKRAMREKKAFSSLRGVTGFCRDENGQGIIFTAASMVVLVFFVALVANIGRLTDRRTKMQVAADAGVYSAAMVQANTLSAVGWINSMMTQVYYNALKYAVDVNVAGVWAEMDRRTGGSGGLDAYNEAYARAETGLRLAKKMMVDLSRIENAMIILAPRLAAEEMITVARIAGEENSGPERVASYPSFRMFPSSRERGARSYKIERLDQGWRVTYLDSNEMLSVQLVGSDEWHIEYSTDGVTSQQIIIKQEAENRWRVTYESPPGTLVSEVILLRTEDGNWTVMSGETGEDGQVEPMPRIDFENVDMDGDGVNDGVKITVNDIPPTTDILRWGDDGNLYRWDPLAKEYVNITSNETTIGGVRVKANVTNIINFGRYASARIGNPTVLSIGRTSIVLRDPPSITAHMGDVHITVRGFDPDSFSIWANGLSLRLSDCDGAWRKHYNTRDELFWRHRLTPQAPTPPAVGQWQYDIEWLGPLMRYEQNQDGRFLPHVFANAPGGKPVWANWFDCHMEEARPRYTSLNHQDFSDYFERIVREDGTYYYKIRQMYIQDFKALQNVYYQIRYSGGRGNYACASCSDYGWAVETIDGQEWWVKCKNCTPSWNDPTDGGYAAHDYNGDGYTDIAVFIDDFLEGSSLGRSGGEHYNEAKIFKDESYDLPRANPPIVLSDEFFRFGLNLGTHHKPEEAMLYPESVTPGWGVLAISSARVGIADSTAPGGYRYHFETKEGFDDFEDRNYWCSNHPNNLYTADIRAKLIPVQEQMKQYDLDEDLLIGESIATETETPLSYIMDGVFGSRQSYTSGRWLTEFGGQNDPSVSAAIRAMRNRDGRSFDYRHEGVEEVVKH